MTLRWGILGTGNIAKTFAAGLKAAKHGALVAVGSRSLATALAFGKDHGDLPASKCYGSYDEVLQDPDVDIVYICSPHPQHYAMALQAAQAKKHMLVEKPIAMTLRQVETIVNVCKDNNVFLMEAYMYRCHPQTKALAEHVKNGAIGQVKLIRASFAYDGTQFDHTSRLWRHELGGGAVMDIGGYPMSLARLIVGAARGQPFVNPTQIKAVGHVQPSTKVDEWSIASLHFDEADGQHAISAQLFAGIFADSDCSVEVIGTEGSLRVANLWRPDLTFLGSVQLEWKKKG
ncbi:NAD(P)-binding protein, partial [Hesseltinella vesiculosa]